MGTSFYVNDELKEISLEPPPRPLAPAFPVLPAPSGWREEIDPDTQTPFWVNDATREIALQPPLVTPVPPFEGSSAINEQAVPQQQIAADLVFDGADVYMHGALLPG